MDAIRQSVLTLALFSAAAGCAELLMPKGKARSCAEAIFGLLAVRWMLEIARAALRALPH